MIDVRSGREHGLHERAARLGASLPCPIQWITIPMKESSDSESFEFVRWPMLLPEDFDFGLKFRNHVSHSVFYDGSNPIHTYIYIYVGIDIDVYIFV